MSIKAKIIAFSVFVTVVVACCFYLTQNWSHNKALDRQEIKLLTSKRILWQNAVDTQINRMQDQSRILARDRDTIKLIHKAQFGELENTAGTAYNLLSTKGIITDLSIYIPSGETVYSSDSDAMTQTRSTLLEKTIETQKPQSGLEFSDSNELVARFVFPLYRRAQPIAYANYQYSLEGAAAQYKLVSGSDLIIISTSGSILLSTNDDLAKELSISPPIDGDYELGVIDTDAQSFSFETIPAQSQDNMTLAYVVNVDDDTDSISEQRFVTLSSFSIAISVFIVGISLLAYYLHRIFKPVALVVNELKYAADGDLGRDLSCLEQNNGANNEFTELTRSAVVFVEKSLEAQRVQQERDQLALQQQEQNAEREAFDLKARKEQQSRHELALEKAALEKAESEEMQNKVDVLMEAVSAATTGRLSYPIEIHGDDIVGQMGSALKTLFGNLSSSMTSINGNATRLTDASGSLAKLSIDMNSISVSNSEQTTQAARLTSNVGASVESIASATEKMSSSIKKIANNTQQAEVIAAKAVNEINSADATFRKLADSSDGISQVTKMITSIAEQTNLLALNATIEAARAGEAGKGFAVVANEVKELANQTSKATEQIEGRIKDIQNESRSAVSVVGSISNIIQEISALQSKITIAVDEQSTVTHNISEEVARTSTSSLSISGIVDDVAQKAEMNQKASDELSQAAKELSSMSTQLQSMVSMYAA